MNSVLLRKVNRLGKNIELISRFVSTKINNQEIINHRARLFDEEQNRQLKEIKRIEKIQVQVNEPGQDCTLIMNKDLSTPYSCSLHMSEMLSKRSSLAVVNDEIWDMHRPLENDCDLKFLHFKDNEPFDLNIAYWRSCAFLLGYVLEKAFKNNVFVELISPTNPHIKTGSFSYDTKLHINNWKPTRDELRCLSIGATQLIQQNLKFERLKVNSELAKEIFKHNEYKLNHLNNVAGDNEYKKDITVYKLGEFVDLSNGPLIANTSLIGRFSITNLFDIESVKNGNVQRVQGISIPSQLQLHSWTYDLLVERASKPSRTKPAFDELAATN